MKLYLHQREAIKIGSEKNVALFHDCGTGKTVTALGIVQQGKARGQTPTLVVCPLSVIEAAWLNDIRRFAPYLSAVSLWSKNLAERKACLAEKHDIYIVNYDTFKNLYQDICEKGFKVLIVDESSKMKNHKSQITQALLSLAGIRFRGSNFKTETIIPHRYVLSGTPAPNDLIEYWPQIKFITGPGNEIFNQNFYAFRGKYFYLVDIGQGRKIPKFRQYMQDEFMASMQPVTHVVRKADALDLPEQVHQIRAVELSSKEYQAYKALKKTYVLRFSGETILATTALTEIMKLRQLTSGFCYGQNGTYQTGTSKLDELKLLLSEIGNHQVIIWANFRCEIRQLLRVLPNSVALWGDGKDRQENIKKFQQGNCRYLIANPASAGHGLTFTNCSYAVYFSLNYSYELQKQSQDRIHRIGQKNKCTYYYLIAKNTVDQVIYKAVTEKEKFSNHVLRYLKGVLYDKQASKIAV